MNYHPHLHTIVLGGGLDAANMWKDKGKKFFFPVKVMSAVFKKYYLCELKQLWEEKKLEYHGTAAHLLPRIYRCRGLSLKDQSNLTQTARNPRAVFCIYSSVICI